MLAAWSRIIGDRLALALGQTQEAADRAAYALENLFLFLLTLAAIVLTASLAGLFWPTIIAAATGAVMRKASGGAHLSSPWRCILVSTSLGLLLGFTGRLAASFLVLPGVAGFVVMAGALILFRYAPASTPAKPIPPLQRRTLKVFALILLGLWTLGIFALPVGRDLLGASVAGMTWQLLTITPAGYACYHIIDGLWAKGGEKKCVSCS